MQLRYFGRGLPESHPVCVLELYPIVIVLLSSLNFCVKYKFSKGVCPALRRRKFAIYDILYMLLLCIDY